VKLSVACVLGLLASAAAASAGVGGNQPTLTLSVAHGPPGTRVLVRGQHCTKPFKSPDTLAWHDHYYWLHDREKRPPLGVWRSIPVTRTSRTTVRATFVVRRSDRRGVGLLDLFCGGIGNATATFTVTR
jgi:hypothetical protein